MCYCFAKSMALCLVLVVMLTQGCGQDKASGQNANRGGGAQTFADAQSAATSSLETLRKLVTNENYKELGFESASEPARASLAEPLHVFVVSLDQLREYQVGRDPNALLSDANQIHYPVNVGDQPRCSIVVEDVDGKWKAASIGNAGLAKQISEVRKGVAASPADSIVQVRALGLYFIGHRGAENKLTLTSLVATEAANLRAGATQPADEVFAALAPLARKYNGLPM